MNDPFEILHDELVRVATAPAALTMRSRVRSPRRPGSSRRFGRPLVLVVVLIGGSASAGGLALAGTFNQTAEDPQAWVNGQRVAPEQAIPPDQSADLAILRRPRVASDALSQAQASDYTNTPDAAYGPNPALSRRAEGFTAGAAFLIPGNGNICFEAHFPVAGGGGTCGSDSEYPAGRVMIFGFNESAPGLIGVAGVVPDGVNMVTVTPANGPVQTLPVHENVYMTEIPHGDFSVSFDGPNGPVSLNASDPTGDQAEQLPSAAEAPSGNT